MVEQLNIPPELVGANEAAFARYAAKLKKRTRLGTGPRSDIAPFEADARQIEAAMPTCGLTKYDVLNSNDFELTSRIKSRLVANPRIKWKVDNIDLSIYFYVLHRKNRLARALPDVVGPNVHSGDVSPTVKLADNKTEATTQRKEGMLHQRNDNAIAKLGQEIHELKSDELLRALELASLPDGTISSLRDWTADKLHDLPTERDVRMVHSQLGKAAAEAMTEQQRVARARKGGKKSADSMTKKDREARASKGGKRAAESMTPEQLSERGRKGGEARARKKAEGL